MDCFILSELQDFYPRSPRGERRSTQRANASSLPFLSTLPARGATKLKLDRVIANGISIHAPREGSDAGHKGLCRMDKISIHAPREGSDSIKMPSARPCCNFYPRSPRGERRSLFSRQQINGRFLSTLPARGATQTFPLESPYLHYFYPRSPRGERRDADRRYRLQGDDFYPRSPRGERPSTAVPVTSRSTNFYPRSPRGERLRDAVDRRWDELFLSTLPARGATDQVDGLNNICINFYPRSPRGERPSSKWPRGHTVNFYPRSPRGERPRSVGSLVVLADFYPRSPRGERRKPPVFKAFLMYFYPRSPRGERHPDFCR